MRCGGARQSAGALRTGPVRRSDTATESFSCLGGWWRQEKKTSTVVGAGARGSQVVARLCAYDFGGLVASIPQYGYAALSTIGQSSICVLAPSGRTA